MPEGPEVRITTEYLNNELAGSTLISTNIIGGRYHSTKETKKNPPKNWSNLQQLLTLENCKIEWVDCKGKTIFFKFSAEKGARNLYMKCGLGMTGRWNKKEVIDNFYHNKKHPHRAIEFTYVKEGKTVD